LLKFDRALRIWIETPAARMQEISRIISNNIDQVNSKHGYHKGSSNFTIILASRALAHFWRKKVKPYLILPGPIELDETKVGCERGYMKGVSGWHPIFKWVFGMYCRKTHLTIM
jgi:hypothetical protein